MKLAPITMALSLVAFGTAIAAAGLLMGVPSYESLVVASGRVDGVHTRRQTIADASDNLHVELRILGEAGATFKLAFRQPESRLHVLHALNGRDIVARLGPEGALFDLRVGQVSLHTYMQTVEPMMVDKAWLLVCGAMFAGVGLTGVWLTRQRWAREASALGGAPFASAA